MKRLLAFLLSLLPVLAWGANPSFDSFRQTNSGFIVNQPYIYVANTNTGGTNVIINGDVIYTNTTISYFVTTNFYDQSTIIITNSTVTITNSTVTINGTNVATINPTIGRIPFKFSDFQFGDSALYHIDTNTVGTTDLETGIVGVSNLVSGGFVISVDSGLGYGYLTNAPFSDFGLWTNIYGYLQPTDLTQPLFWTNSVTWGPGTTNFLSRTGSDLNWTGSSTDVKFLVNDGSGGAAQLEAQGATAVLSAGGVATGVTLRAGGDQVTLAGGHFIPTVDVSENNGDAHNAWKNVTSTNFIVRGFVDSTDTNYSRLDIYHTGTNGAVVFDSQAAGIAGDARQFFWNFNGTNALYLLRAGTDHFMRLSSPSNSGLVQEVASDVAGQTSLVIGGATGGAMEISPDGVPGNDSVAPYEFQTLVTSSGPIFNVKNGATTNVFQLYASGPARLAQITKAQKTLVTPFDGMLVYQTDNTPGLRAYINGAWVILQTAADP